jgi:hypothetical protein
MEIPCFRRNHGLSREQSGAGAGHNEEARAWGSPTGCNPSTGPGPVLFEGTGHTIQTKDGSIVGAAAGAVGRWWCRRGRQSGAPAGVLGGCGFSSCTTGCANTGHCFAVACCRGEAPRDRIIMRGFKKRPKLRTPGRAEGLATGGWPVPWRPASRATASLASIERAARAPRQARPKRFRAGAAGCG